VKKCHQSWSGAEVAGDKAKERVTKMNSGIDNSKSIPHSGDFFSQVSYRADRSAFNDTISSTFLYYWLLY